MPVRAENPAIEPVVLKFGAGLNSRASESSIADTEAADGQNFDLDIESTLFSRRKPFDLVATATNGEEINGFAQLIKVDDTRSTLVQAGTTVYEWDGASGFTVVGTVASGTKIRGYRDQNFTLTDEVIITDLNERHPVMKWDGTTFQQIAHNLGGSFFARYCQIVNERALFANVRSGTSLPHVVVGSARGDFEILSISDRPSSALSEEDPYFLPMQDLRYINGLAVAFGVTAVSTRNGRIFKITGDSAKDFTVDVLYADSAASGDEAVTFIGNDVAYGRIGRIETLFAAEALGDVETDDLSKEIANLTEDVSDWLLAFSSRRQRVYCWDRERSQIFVFHKAFVDERIRAVIQRRDPAPISPWSLWETDHPSAFQTQVCMPLLDPGTGLEEMFFGGPNGEIFKFDGGGGQDGGTTDLTASRTSRVFQAPFAGPMYSVNGVIRYRKIFPATVTLTLVIGGVVLEDQAITITLPSATGLPVYAGGLFYNDDQYYSAPFKGRFSNQVFGFPGRGNEFQLKVDVTGSTDFFIEEVALFFKTA